MTDSTLKDLFQRIVPSLMLQQSFCLTCKFSFNWKTTWNRIFDFFIHLVVLTGHCPYHACLLWNNTSTKLSVVRMIIKALDISDSTSHVSKLLDTKPSHNSALCTKKNKLIQINYLNPMCHIRSAFSVIILLNIYCLTTELFTYGI